MGIFTFPPVRRIWNLIIFGAVLTTDGFAVFRIEDQNVTITCDLLAKDSKSACMQVVDNRSNSKFQFSSFQLVQQSHNKTRDCHTSC